MIWKWTKRILPVIIGAVGGYLYYQYIGCNRGCAITGNPWTSTLWGALIGFLFSDWNLKSLFSKKTTRENEGDA